MSVNKVFLIGNLGADPEIKMLESGMNLGKMNIATTNSWKDKDGQMQEKTEWHTVVAFGKLADLMGEYLSKGRQVYVEGSLTTRSWEDDEGQKRYKTEVKAHRIDFLSSPKSAGNQEWQDAKPSGEAMDLSKVKNYAPGADNSGVESGF